MTQPDITVAICTWNRADSLAETLQAMTAMTVPADCDWELVVVNNACTDHTSEAVAGFAGRLPVREVQEPKPGLSNARNRAIREAAGRHIVWTDDDVTVDPDWLAAYHAAFARHPEADVFGGPVIPDFQGDPPGWLLRQRHRVGNVYAERLFGDAEFAFEAYGKRLPFGANFAIRTATQARYHYDPALGFTQGKLVAGEESQVINDILAGGGSGWWVPGAPVKHRIEPFRQSVAYVRRYFVGQGEQLAPQRLADKPGRCPRWLYRKWLGQALRARLHRLLGRESDWLEETIGAAVSRGMLNWCRDNPRPARAPDGR